MSAAYPAATAALRPLLLRHAFGVLSRTRDMPICLNRVEEMNLCPARARGACFMDKLVYLVDRSAPLDVSQLCFTKLASTQRMPDLHVVILAVDDFDFDQSTSAAVKCP